MSTRDIVLIASTHILLAGLAAAGGAPEPSVSAGVRVNPPGTYPIVEETITVRVWTQYLEAAHDGDYAGAAFTGWFEELTNIRLDFVEIVEAALAAERLNLVLASGDLPDVFMNQQLPLSAQMVYSNGLRGNFIGVDDLIERNMPNLQRLLDEYPEYAAQLTMPDGRRYAFPSIEAGCYHCTMSKKMWVYRPWLEELGLEAPETTEEFYEMLVAFRDGDPNRNGLGDEIPLAAATTGWRGQPLMPFVMNSFVYTDPRTFLMRDRDDLVFVPSTDEWREGLRYINRLYSERLFAPESFVQSQAQLRAIVENEAVPLVGAFPAGWYGVFAVNASPTGRYADYHPIAPLVGPSGMRQTTYYPPAIDYHTIITPRARYPQAIAQMVDWFYESYENMMLGQFFWEYDVHYRSLSDAERQLGLVSRDGTPGRYIDIGNGWTYHAERSIEGWWRMAPKWDVVNLTAMPLEWADDPTRQEWRLAEATRDLYEPYRADHHMPPRLVVAERHQDTLAELTHSLIGESGDPGLVMRYYAAFVTGSRDVNSDSEWDGYLEELRRAGMDAYVEIWRQTLSRQSRGQGVSDPGGAS